MHTLEWEWWCAVTFENIKGFKKYIYLNFSIGVNENIPFLLLFATLCSITTSKTVFFHPRFSLSSFSHFIRLIFGLTGVIRPNFYENVVKIMQFLSIICINYANNLSPVFFRDSRGD